jgi:hypothetical protein
MTQKEEKAKLQGELSKSMGVDTKPAHRFKIDGYWVMVDSKMPNENFELLKKVVLSDYDLFRKNND